MEAREDDGPTLDEVVARTADDVDGVSRGGRRGGRSVAQGLLVWRA